MDDELLCRTEGRVRVITINRPERLNALTASMMRGLVAMLADCAVDEAVGCVVVTGAGRAFCAGGDVQVQAASLADVTLGTPEHRADDLRKAMEAARLLHEMPKPSIAMLNGVAAGAGFSLALACDLRIAGESARATTAFAKVGLSGDFGGSWFLSRLIGSARARELYFTSDILDARRMEALGIANRMVLDDELGRETMALATRLANGPSVAWRYMKRNLNLAEHNDLAATLDSEALGMMRCRQTEDHAEAARAFMEKRAPVFKGR